MTHYPTGSKASVVSTPAVSPVKEKRKRVLAEVRRRRAEHIKKRLNIK